MHGGALGGDGGGVDGEHGVPFDDRAPVHEQQLQRRRGAQDEGGADEILPVHFAQLEPPPPQKAKPRFNCINNVFVNITVELGRREMTVREIKELKVQDVIDVDKLAGEAFDILVNKRPFAEGEIVVVTDLMAVRITRLIKREAPEEEEE